MQDKAEMEKTLITIEAQMIFAGAYKKSVYQITDYIIMATKTIICKKVFYNDASQWGKFIFAE